MTKQFTHPGGGFLAAHQCAVETGDPVEVTGELNPRGSVDTAPEIGDPAEAALIDGRDRLRPAHDGVFLQVARQLAVILAGPIDRVIEDVLVAEMVCAVEVFV